MGIEGVEVEKGPLFFLPTNWAKQEIRPALVTRKVCGGNRSWHGAQAQEIIASVLRTSIRQENDHYLFVLLLRSCSPIAADCLCIPDEPPTSEPPLTASS